VSEGDTRRRREQQIDQTTANRLVGTLASIQRRRLLDRCEHVEVHQRPAVQLGRGRDSYSYFPTDCVISVLLPVDGRHGMEVATVGREGLFGVQSWIGVRPTELRAIVSTPGHAWRIANREFDALADADPDLRRMLQRYLRMILAQTARHAACCRFHPLAQRLARWLLTHADCAPTDDVLVTHQRLATLLGAQRAGITSAIGTFERRGLIGAARGHILLLDRPALLQEACSCYGANRDAYSRALGMRQSDGAPAGVGYAGDDGRNQNGSYSRPRLAAKALASARDRTRSLR
jgi:CRP-like cAMP-binding protein